MNAAKWDIEEKVAKELHFDSQIHMQLRGLNKLCKALSPQVG
jgi:hypothetical protein